jgi:RNA polymerase sigma-70 factor (ECF subfamily)
VPVELTDQIEGAEPAGVPSDLNVTEETILVAVAKRGDAPAFAVLVERHERKILAVARRVTRTREDAEDVVQQSFQKAFLHLHQFEGRSSFSTWLTRIAINEARMLQRGIRGAREVSIDDSNTNEETASALEIPDSSPDPETSYSQRERLRMLSLALNELPPRTREAIQLHELDERSTEETARIMGITVSALKGRMFHGRRKLRERLLHHFGSAWVTGRETLRARGNTRDLSRHQLPCNACG